MRFLSVLLLLPLFAFSQEEIAPNDSYFVALYTIGNNWDVQKQPHEQHYFEEHSSFLKTLRTNQQIVIGARYSETGMIVLKAQSLDAAVDLLHSDTAVQNKLFEVEVHPFALFYKGCL